MTTLKDIELKVLELGKREVDIFIAKFFYKTEVLADRVKIRKGGSKIKYLIRPYRKIKYRRYSGRSLSPKQKNFEWRPLPLYCTMIHESERVLNDACKIFGAASIYWNVNHFVVRLGEVTVTGKNLSEAIARTVLINALYREELNYGKTLPQVD